MGKEKGKLKRGEEERRKQERGRERGKGKGEQERGNNKKKREREHRGGESGEEKGKKSTKGKGTSASMAASFREAPIPCSAPNSQKRFTTGTGQSLVPDKGQWVTGCVREDCECIHDW